LTKETLAVATGVDSITTRALEVGDLVRPEFVAIFFVLSGSVSYLL
jgi:hypothetical protein